jgi:hypothetical protein
MSRTPVESNFLSRFVVGLGVITGMFLSGGAVGSLLQSAAVPYGAWVGAGLAAVGFFVAFTLAYRRYDASFDPQ